MEKRNVGRIYFVGAGPGDPELLTIRAHKILSSADVIIYTGSLISEKILRMFPKAKKINSHGLTLEEISDEMIRGYHEGKTVARLHDGDPSIFGSIKEQFEVLEERGVDFEVVPGVSSFSAAAAVLKIEYTIPEVVQTVVMTRYPGRTEVPENIIKIARQKPSLVFFLSAHLLDKMVSDLMSCGFEPDFPCAVCYKVGWDDQKIILGTLSDISSKADAEGIRSHALFIVSEALRKSGRRSFLYSRSYAESLRSVTRPQDKDVLIGRFFPRGIALIALTKGGIETALSIAEKLLPQRTAVFIPDRFKGNIRTGNVKCETFGNLREAISRIFRNFDAVLGIMALGVLVRYISPLLRRKGIDPAVLCADEGGKFIISVLGGHARGANDLARMLAERCGATAVITTSSDSLGIIPVDTLGRELGWKIKASRRTLIRVSSAVVNGEKICVVDEVGTGIVRDKENFVLFKEIEDFIKRQEEFSACLFISYRRVRRNIFRIPVIRYFPPVLHVGIGADRGVSAEDIYGFIKYVFRKFSLSLESIGRVATVDAKVDDEEFSKLGRILKSKLGIELLFVPRDKLSGYDGITHSEHARRYLGVPSVSEASALFSSGGGKLIVTKQVRPSGGVTVAVAVECESKHG